MRRSPFIMRQMAKGKRFDRQKTTTKSDDSLKEAAKPDERPPIIRTSLNQSYYETNESDNDKRQ